MGGLTASERYAFDVAGYLVRRGALKRRELAELNAAVDALHVPEPGDDIASQRFGGHLHRSRAFVALLDHPAVFDVLVELCGPVLRLDHSYGIVMRAGTLDLAVNRRRQSLPLRPFLQHRLGVA